MKAIRIMMPYGTKGSEIRRIDFIITVIVESLFEDTVEFAYNGTSKGMQKIDVIDELKSLVLNVPKSHNIILKK